MNPDKILLIFIDGLGIGGTDPIQNPLVAFPQLWPVTDTGPARTDIGWKPIDACLGVEGLPQSATGQTALLTGVNAPALIGKHVQGFPSRKLIEILQQESIFLKLKQDDYRATFANAYRHPEDISPASRLSVTSHAFKATGEPFRSVNQIERGESLYHDFTNRELLERGYHVPALTPEEASAILLNIAGQHHFTLYEHFMTDVVAHRGSRAVIDEQVEKLSRFMTAVLDRRPAEIQIIITSDHGNIEDLSTRTHTRHPVPLLWTVNPAVNSEPLVKNISQITPWMLQLIHRRAP